MYGCVPVCVWRLVRECRAFAGRAGGALIGEERCLTESGSRIFDDNSPMRSCLSLGDVDALDLPLLLCDLAFVASLALKGLRHR